MEQPSKEPRYSENDVAEMRQRWEQVEKERRIEGQLAELTGQIKSLPELIRSIAHSEALNVVAESARLKEEARARAGTRRWTNVERIQIFVGAIATCGVVYLALFGVSHPLVHIP